jgi:CheY-like chemotaxis protein
VGNLSHSNRSVDRPVLVIDDDDDARDATVELLEGAGYSAVTAANGLEALELLRGGIRPRAMVVDFFMPRMDGEAFCIACDLIPDLKAIPRIVISANPRAEEQLERCHTRLFVSKPIDPDDLFGALGVVNVLPI